MSRTNIFMKISEDVIRDLNVKTKNFVNNELYSSNKLPNKKLFFNYEKYSEFEKTIQLYSKLKRDITNNYCTDELSNWFDIISDLCVFIRFAEKCFMFDNSDSKKIYAEYNDNSTILYYKENDFKVKIKTETSKIKNPTNIAYSILDKPSENNMKFTTIEIARNYGKCMNNTFKFYNNTTECNITYYPDEDIYLLKYICQKISKDIIIIYDEIVQKIIDDYLNITTLDWSDIENGLWVRTNKSK